MEMEKEKEKEQQQANPLAPANGHARSDQESANEISREARRKKRTKYIIYGIAFVIFQTIVMTIAALTIMKFRNPKFRVRSASFDSTFEVGTAASPTFNIHMNAVLGVKNNNFGPFKYRNTTVDFYYRDTRVGEAMVRKSSVNIRDTKKVNVAVNLSSANLSSTTLLASDITSGTLRLTSQSRIRGKVTILFMMTKKRSTNMNCTMDIVLATKQLQNLQCN